MVTEKKEEFVRPPDDWDDVQNKWIWWHWLSKRTKKENEQKINYIRKVVHGNDITKLNELLKIIQKAVEKALSKRSSEITAAVVIAQLVLASATLPEILKKTREILIKVIRENPELAEQAKKKEIDKITRNVVWGKLDTLERNEWIEVVDEISPQEVKPRSTKNETNSQTDQNNAEMKGGGWGKRYIIYIKLWKIFEVCYLDLAKLSPKDTLMFEIYDENGKALLLRYEENEEYPQASGILTFASFFTDKISNKIEITHEKDEELKLKIKTPAMESIKRTIEALSKKLNIEIKSWHVSAYFPLGKGIFASVLVRLTISSESISKILDHLNKNTNKGGSLDYIVLPYKKAELVDSRKCLLDTIEKFLGLKERNAVAKILDVKESGDPFPALKHKKKQLQVLNHRAMFVAAVRSVYSTFLLIENDSSRESKDLAKRLAFDGIFDRVLKCFAEMAIKKLIDKHEFARIVLNNDKNGLLDHNLRYSLIKFLKSKGYRIPKALE